MRGRISSHAKQTKPFNFLFYWGINMENETNQVAIEQKPVEQIPVEQKIETQPVVQTATADIARCMDCKTEIPSTPMTRHGFPRRCEACFKRVQKERQDNWKNRKRVLGSVATQVDPDVIPEDE